MAKLKTALDPQSLIGKRVQIELKDRTESEWIGVELNDLSDAGVVFSFEARGNNNAVFVPMQNINYILHKASIEGATEVTSKDQE